jgi:hypothetical protein
MHARPLYFKLLSYEYIKKIINGTFVPILFSEHVLVSEPDHVPLRNCSGLEHEALCPCHTCMLVHKQINASTS